MPPVQSSSPSLAESLQVFNPEDVEQFSLTISPHFEELGLEVHPFKVKWYNQIVAADYKLNYDGDVLAFLVVSKPSMFELAFLRYLKEVLHLCDENISDYFDPIDKCMQYYFNLLKQKMSYWTHSAIDVTHDFELNMPSRRPKILLQTAAHVAGAAYYYKRINTSKHRLGVCIHPKFGGWFGIRGAFFLKDVHAPSLQPPQPIDVVSKEEQSKLLEMFNERWQDWSYRDIIETQDKYSPLQIKYFSLLPRSRIEFIKSTILPQLRQQ